MKYKVFSQAADGTRFAIRQSRTAKRVVVHLLGFLVAVTLLAYLGPFGTWTALAPFDRLAFWMIAVGVNWLCAALVFSITMRVFFERDWHRAAGILLASIVTAVPGTAAVWLVVAAYLDYRPADLAEVFGLYSQVVVLQVIIGTLVFLIVSRELRREAGTEESSGPARKPPGAASGAHPAGAAEAGSRPRGPAAAAPAQALLARLPARRRGELLHMRMQDHYVEVHTTRGMEMLLLRFRDALREVEYAEGMQVHRSHWVAQAAVDGVERRDGRVTLRLVNGSKVPVSRSFAPALRARGWI